MGIIRYSQLTTNLTDDTIDEIIEDSNYIGYIPYNFVRDLFSIWSQLVITGNIKNAFEFTTEYDKAVYNIVKEIVDNFNYELASRAFIIKILQLLSDKIDFRKVETSRMTGTTLLLQEDVTNYSFDINDLSANVQEALDIDIISKQKLPRKIENILHISNELKHLPGTEISKFSFTRSKMTKYSQISKVLKHKLIDPMFKYKFATKDLPVKYPGINRNTTIQIVLMIDVSESAKNNETYDTLVNSILLYYINRYNLSTKITVVMYAYYVTEVILIQSVKDLIKLYKTPRTYVLQEAGWQAAFNSIEATYSNYNIICIHDGVGMFNIPLVLNNSWYIVSSQFNKYLNKLVKKSKGNYIEYDIK